ncbi:MAG: hypothetical protein DMF95_15060 [Acidobacteria bacterium]|nr:MAG: hypothetical protein DMF96_14535 [Acidobacteriota bacterium]PYR15439.1 MAG: hypothetical protein DMF94_31995 [Acidobacteriota bacterium]PYR48037.1 MAG: hypothetical protein DMF95_15060 [Acidobacteriota bacterium]
MKPRSPRPSPALSGARDTVSKPILLSRFVNTPGLKREISFEAPAEGDQAKSKGDETKTALRELALSEDIEIR